MMAQGEAKKAAKAKRRAKRKKSRPEAELHVEWSTRFRMRFGDVEVPPWGPAERSLARKMADEFGFDRSVEMIRHFIDTWEARMSRRQAARGEVPAMKLLWYLRQKLLAEMDGAVRTPRSKRSRILDDEYDEDAASESPDEGW